MNLENVVFARKGERPCLAFKEDVGENREIIQGSNCRRVFLMEAAAAMLHFSEYHYLLTGEREWEIPSPSGEPMLKIRFDVE